MSAPLPDDFFYEGQQYSVIRKSAGGLFSPEQYGITTAMLNTGCYRGYLCTYEIVGGQLFLAAAIIQAKDVGGYPLINDAPPEFGEEAIGDFVPPACYNDINLPIAFTGSFLLAADLDGSFLFSMYERPLWMWRKLIAIEFADGRVQSVKDRSEEMAKIRAKKPKPVFSEGGCINADELRSMDSPECSDTP